MASTQPSEMEHLRRQLDRAGRTNAELALLVDVSRELSRSLDIVDIGGLVARTAASLTGAALCTLWVSDGGPELRAVTKAEGIPATDLPTMSLRLSLLERAFTSKQTIVDDRVIVALPILFDDTLLAVLELVGIPLPEHLPEQLETLRRTLPVAALSLKNALASAQLHEALDDISRKNTLLETQNEELQAQFAEIQAQSEEIQAQNEELGERQQELEIKNNEIDQANRELSRLIETSRWQEARTRAIVDFNADGLMVVDGEQRVITVNPALEALTGYSADELVGRACKYLLDAHQSSGHSLCDSTCPFLHPEDQCPHSVDATVTTKDGRRVWVNVAYGPIYDAKGRPTAVVHAIRDISARKELEELKDEFLSMTAHDLKSPLTSIKGFAQLMLRRILKDDSRAGDVRGLETIDAQASRMLRMIERLLDLTRIQMGRLELCLEPVDLLELAERVVEQAQVTTEQHQLQIRAEAENLVGSWDGTYVEEVLGNLVDNAIKYSPEGGQVEVTLRRSEGEALVSVRDQGSGISKADQSHLFGRYFRAAEARRAARGLGIGLYISRGLIEAHGGRIWVESQQGQGSTFHFTLPLAQG